MYQDPITGFWHQHYAGESVVCAMANSIEIYRIKVDSQYLIPPSQWGQRVRSVSELTERERGWVRKLYEEIPMALGTGDARRLVDVALDHFNAVTTGKNDVEVKEDLLQMFKAMREEVSQSNPAIRETFHRLVMEVESRIK